MYKAVGENLLRIAIVLVFFLLFCFSRPTSLITYTDEAYMNKLQTCSPYAVKGKLKSIGDTDSTSRILGYVNGKCKLQTINVFNTFKTARATNCSLNSDQLQTLHQARLHPIFGFKGFSDRSLLSEYLKSGDCVSYRLEKGKWAVQK